MKTAIIFSGQGAQYPGMGRDLYENSKEFKEVFDEAAEALSFPLLEYAFNAENKAFLDDTEFSQPIIYAMCAGIIKMIEKTGFKAEITAGLSLGEYTALMYSGAFSFKDGLTLLTARGKYMAEASKHVDGVMSAVLNLAPELVQEACKEAAGGGRGAVSVSNLNTPGQVVISGERSAVEKAEELCKAKGAKRSMRLAVSGPYHTVYMEPAAQKLSQYLKNVQIGEMTIPVVSNVDGEVIADKEEIAPLLLKQLVSPVRWELCVRNMIAMGVDTFIEAGPGKALSGFVKRVSADVKIYNIEDMASFEACGNGIFIK